MAPIPAHIAQIERPVPQLMRLYVFQALATTLAFPVMLVVLYFRYHTMRYQFTNEGIRKSWGIIFRHEVMLNYARIQDIHLRSNLIERWLGLARIDIQTASGATGAEMTLEGLTDHEAMRDFLYSRMRGAHEKHPAAAPESPASGLAPVLDEIAGELRAIRQLLEQRRHE
jgi:uncharacterized membrane protein YdbT with pleckstrin-like domain